MNTLKLRRISSGYVDDKHGIEFERTSDGWVATVYNSWLTTRDTLRAAKEDVMRFLGE